jgi:hypothetical protein
MGEESMETLGKIEAVGSETGKPKHSVKIAECGQLYPSVR